jgi:dipeptidyl aminopeptidase/acylaminoacyl peptidase
MGGGIAWSVAVLVPDVDAFVQFAPVSADAVDSYNRWMREYPEQGEEVKQAYGEPEQNPEFWKQISPLTSFDRITAPIQIHHGTADRDVPLEWSEKTVNRLRELGNRVELFVYPHEPHEFAGAWPLVMQRTVSFLRTNLK